MSDAHVALEASDGLRVEDIADHAVGLDLVEATTRTAGDDTSCVLATKDVSGKSQGAAGPPRFRTRLNLPVLEKRKTLSAANVSN